MFVDLNLKEENISAFRRGTVISIKHPMVFEPILSVVQKVEGSNIFFRLPEDFLKNNILKGDDITCHALLRDYELVIEGMIRDNDLNYPRLVQVCANKIQKFRNNRKTKRYFVCFQANVHLPGVDKKVYAIIKNISSGGLAAVFKEYVAEDITVKISVSASISRNEFLEFKAKTTRVIPRGSYNEYGMEIIEIDEYNQNMLDKLLFKLQEDESRFVLECMK